MAVNRFGVHSEYGRLTSVLLFCPGPEIGACSDPVAVQHLRAIDPAGLAREFDAIAAAYRDLGIDVLLIDPAPLGDDRRYLYNLMYCRDLFFMTPRGAILSNMAGEVRREEVRYAERALKAAGIPVLHTVSGAGRFEGADAIWVHDRLVAVGVGNRTNREAHEQIREVLQPQGVACVSLPSHQTRTQHLLGSLQFVDRDLALVRHEIVDGEVLRFLAEQRVAVVNVPENGEVRTRQAMNIVTVAPRTVVMTAGCPETRAIYRGAGLSVAAELELTQLMGGAGGLACATGIVGRG